MPPARCRAARRRRSLSRRRSRQGHRDLLRHRQRDRARTRLLARRCVRIRRLGRLRPQEDGHHRPRRLGIGEAPFPRNGHRHPDARSPSSASATCRATCSATACCANAASSSSPPSIIATSSSIPIPIRSAASPSASACSTCRVRAGKISTAGSSPKAAACFRAPRRRSRFAAGAGRPRCCGAQQATPQEVINAILKAPVDLLWFGGIGTYVRASARKQRGGRRPRQRCCPRRWRGAARKVIGEGANLGITQRGRIEAALRGIRLNTDAIDNSAGVNTSDVEVNLKIALSAPLRAAV